MAACHKKVYIKVREAVLPPDQYLEECITDYGQGTIEDTINGLAEGIECERTDKAAIKSWKENYKPE